MCLEDLSGYHVLHLSQQLPLIFTVNEKLSVNRHKYIKKFPTRPKLYIIIHM